MHKELWLIHVAEFFCRGAYSVVRLGVNKASGQQVAIKFVNTKMFAKSGDCLRETMKEIGALKQVRPRHHATE